MLARSSVLSHPSGFELKTPLLITSFSSKGFRFIEKDSKLHSESLAFLKATAEDLYETILLSAYDFKYFFPKPEKIPIHAQFTFVDSGGYETLDDYDFSEAYKYPVLIKEWNQDLYKSFLDSWPDRFPAVFVSYDHGNERKIPLIKQINRAEKLFKNYPSQLHNFLIKPSKKGTGLSTDEVIDHISLLKSFHIIGLTEKELGDSIMERMKTIQTIRKALDNVNNTAPIHVFGSLDPVTSILYFLAGAEIFDGLTWLRYSFYKGMSIYGHNNDVIKRRIKEKEDRNKKTNFYENIIYLRNLQSEMRAFLKAKEVSTLDTAFESFKYNSALIKEAYVTLNSL